MNVRHFMITWAATLAGGLLAIANEAVPPVAVREYRGLCDASAAIAIDDQRFLVADDERNVLHLYRVDPPGRELASWSWDAHLDTVIDGEVNEADVEGATRLGELIVWISSHGRNLNGKWRPSRHQLFATRVVVQADRVELQPVGRAYHGLALRLVAAPQLQALGLHIALGEPGERARDLAPKDEGFNIEGLAASPDGTRLWIGFRNPLPAGRALLVPLLNPKEVLLQAAEPQFGEPVLFTLRVRYRDADYALGIRSIEYSPRHQAYLIAAGPPDGQKVFALYQWSGQPTDRPRLLSATREVLQRPTFAPEALVVFPQRAEIGLFSDDGTQRVRVGSRRECFPGSDEKGECEQKLLLDHRRKTFAGLVLPLD